MPNHSIAVIFFIQITNDVIIPEGPEELDFNLCIGIFVYHPGLSFCDG